MADVKVQDLPTAASIDNADYLILDHFVTGSPITSKTTIASFRATINKGTYPWNSEVPVETGIHSRWYADRTGTITWCRGEVVDGDGGVTTSFDVLKNGTSIYPSATKPSVSAGQYTGTERVPDTTAFVDGDYFQVNVVATGGTAGRLRLLINFTS